MSEKRSPPKKDKASSSVSSVKTPQSSSKSETKHLKRKLFIAGAATADEDERKGTSPKRRRSLHSEVTAVSSAATSAVTRAPLISPGPQVACSVSSSATPPEFTALTPGSSASPGHVILSPSVTSTGAVKALGRHAPLSERQQIAKIMQQYADEESKQTGGDLSPIHSIASPPMSAGKRTPYDKKVGKRNEKGETRLHYAAIKGDVKLTKKLIKSGAVVNEKDNAGWTPLHEACNRGHLHVAKHLLKNGANINVLGLENDTPLHDASVNGHLKLIELLLRHGANPLQCNAAGKTPIDVAPNETVLKLLKSETIASCSSSESVTSEVRSPTSPESNLSDDDREDDVKRRKDSPVSEHSSLFMPRSTNMISNIGGLAPSSHTGQGSSSHSPTSTTTSSGASNTTSGSTPSKLLPAIDPYAYHDENEDSDLNTGHLPCSSTTPVRSRPLSNIHVARTAADKGKALGMSYSHHKKSSSASSPKRAATSQLHHEEPKKPKTYSSLFHIADRSSKGKFPGSSASSTFELNVASGSSSLQMSMSPTPSQSSQDSDLYDPQLSGEAGVQSKLRMKDNNMVQQQPAVSPLPAGRVSSSDHVSGDNRLQKSDRHGNNSGSITGSTTTTSNRYKTVESSLQPDSQMPKLSQESGTFTPSRMSEDDNLDVLTDSDDNPLQIDVDSTTTTPTKSVPQKRSTQQSKHIPSSSSKYQAASGGHKSDVSSSNFGSTFSSGEGNKMDSSRQQSPQTTGDTSPYHFTDSPCSVTTLSYKQERVERNKEAAAAATTGATAGSSVSSTGTRYDKQDKGEQKRFTKTDKLSTKLKESLSPPQNISQSDSAPQSGKCADSTVVSGADRTPGSSGKISEGSVPKADTTSIMVKVEIKEEVGSSHSVTPCDNRGSSSSIGAVKDTNVDIKPLTIKIESVKTVKHDSERSKSPKGYDSGGSSRRNSPKLVDSNRSSPKSFSFKDTFPSNASSGAGKAGLPTGSKWDLSNRSSPKSDRDSPKSDKSDSSSTGGAQKVPPLKIILPPKATSAMDRPQSTKVATQQKGNLPYVLNPTQDSAAENAIDSSSFVTSAGLTTATPLAESLAASPHSVKPSHNSSCASSVASGEQEGIEKASSSAVLPFGGLLGQGEEDSSSGVMESGMGGVSSSSQDPGQQSLKRLTRSRQFDRELPRNHDEDSHDSKPDTRSEAGGDGKEDVSERRVTRSQMRSQCGKDKKEGNGNSRDDMPGTSEREEKEGSVCSGTAVSVSDSSSTKAASISGGSAVTTSAVTAGPSATTIVQPVVSSPCVGTSPTMSALPQQTTEEIILHPRKRKALRQRAPNQEQNCTVDTSFNLFPKNNTAEKTANPYEMFLDIRKKVAHRRTEMTVVTPKAPTGFNNYLMVSCKYILQGSTTSVKQDIPMLPTPGSLPEPMKDIFIEQEKTRYKLRLQHMIEREKLRLSIEQEVLRVHGRAARALANQTTPLSVCAILRDEEIYNVIDPEAEEKDKIGARSRYNGRQFLSWLQDVDDKYEKIKESLLMRHHHEAESLHAVQKLDWEWKLKEATLCDYNKTPVVDNTSVPMIVVNDDFELLPS